MSDKIAPCFFFIDPTGYKNLDFDVFQRIGSFQRPEMLINLQTAGIKRNLPQSKAKQKIEKLFGGKLPTGTRFYEILKTFKTTLSECQFKYILHYAVSFEDIAKNMYCLTHVTKNPTGAKIMDEVMRKKYGGGYRGPLDPSKTGQLSFKLNANN